MPGDLAPKQIVEIYDPPMCCSTGICGPTVDQSLIDVNEMIIALKSRGVIVRRYQINAQPKAFAANPEVLERVRKEQLAVLPITTVNRKIIKTGGYATEQEVQAALDAEGAALQ